MKDQKLKAASSDLLIEEVDHAHGHNHSHAHGSFWSKIFKMQNPASIWKGMEMIFHGIEHTLEKGAKLDAAKFALKTAQMLGLPD